jgi:hypothetical protein
MLSIHTRPCPLIPSRNFLHPNPALTPTQSFLLLPESVVQRPSNKTIYGGSFDLRSARGPPLAASLPQAKEFFMIWSSITILNRLGQVPHGMINRTFWEPQEWPLVSTERASWDEHQLVPWTGPEPVWAELTINNLDSSGHPFHLVSLHVHLTAFASLEIGMYQNREF